MTTAVVEGDQMTWGSGGQLLREIVVSAKQSFKYLSDADLKRQHYRVLIESFLFHGCDTVDEALGVDPAFDEVLADVYRERGWVV